MSAEELNNFLLPKAQKQFEIYIQSMTSDSTYAIEFLIHFFFLLLLRRKLFTVVDVWLLNFPWVKTGYPVIF